MTFQYDNSDVTFLICDDIREETNGRQSLMGVYPRNKVIVESSDQTLLPSLGIFFRLDNLKSSVTFTAKLVAPERELGTIGPDHIPGHHTSLLLNIRVAPFPAHDGEYALIVNVDGVEIKNTFTVAHGTLQEISKREDSTSVSAH